MQPFFNGVNALSLLLSIVLIVALYAAASPADAQEYSIEPSEEHKAFQTEVGVWDADITMWMHMKVPDKDEFVKIVQMDYTKR